MTRRHAALLALLADGALHSGASLAARLGVSRAAVWKLVRELREHGVQVASLPRIGYRLPRPVELLDAARIGSLLDDRGWRLGERLEVLLETDSTNTHLHDGPAPQRTRPPPFVEIRRPQTALARPGSAQRSTAGPREEKEEMLSMLPTR